MWQRRGGRVRRRMGQLRVWGARNSTLRGAGQVWSDLRVKDLYRSGKEFELMGRSMGFAALAMLTVFPLLAGSYLAAAPGAVVTMAFLAGLRVFSALVFQPLIVTNAVTYGALGTVLVVQSWLIGVGWVVYSGQLFGRWFDDAWLEAAPNKRGGQGA